MRSHDDPVHPMTRCYDTTLPMARGLSTTKPYGILCIYLSMASCDHPMHPMTRSYDTMHLMTRGDRKPSTLNPKFTFGPTKWRLRTTRTTCGPTCTRSTSCGSPRQASHWLHYSVTLPPIGCSTHSHASHWLQHSLTCHLLLAPLTNLPSIGCSTGLLAACVLHRSHTVHPLAATLTHCTMIGCTAHPLATHWLQHSLTVNPLAAATLVQGPEHHIVPPARRRGRRPRPPGRRLPVVQEHCARHQPAQEPGRAWPTSLAT